MPFFKQTPKSNFHRYSPDNTRATSEIMKTLDHLALNRDEVILVGSAALALYGVTLYDDPLRELYSSSPGKPRPGDTDFITTLNYAQELEINGTQSGLRGKPKKNLSGSPIFSIATRSMPADIIPHSMRASKRDDDRFRQRIERDSVQVSGTDIRAATPHKLLEELARRSRMDKKAATDLSMLRRRFPDL